MVTLYTYVNYFCFSLFGVGAKKCGRFEVREVRETAKTCLVIIHAEVRSSGAWFHGRERERERERERCSEGV